MKFRSWKDRIPGCFDEGTAAFGVHPCDEERALSMLRAAMCQGARWSEVISEVKGYLTSRNAVPAAISEEVKRLEGFRPNPFLKLRLKRAWLTTLEREPAPSQGPQGLVSIFNYRVSANTVRERIEQLYVDKFYDNFAKLAIARNPKENVFSAEFVCMSGLPLIVCGYGPYLVARPVTNLRLEGAESRQQQLRWDEIITPTPTTENVWPQSA